MTAAVSEQTTDQREEQAPADAPPPAEQTPDETPAAPAESAEQPAGAEQAPGNAVAAPGFLAIDPTQNKLRPDQKASLRAIGITDDFDVAQIRVFIHFCQVRRLDPWAKEAYLILRKGRDGKKNYSIQTSIDTYRRKAFETKRYRRKVGVYWTGAANDPDSWIIDPQTRVRHRVWEDVWLRSEHPAAAKCVIEYYDEQGDIVQSEAIANWDMFVGTKSGPNGTKVPNEMWSKGGPHMLAKCLPGRARIETDRGVLTIGEIVDKRLPVKVRSIDLETGQECWQPVVNWWTNAPTNEWVRLWTPNGSRGNKPLRLTPDHPVWTPTGWVKAGELNAGDEVALASPTLSAEQEQVILGGLLGDGSLCGRNRPSTLPHYAEGHSIEQKAYVQWKADALATLGVTVTDGHNTDGAGGRHPVTRLRTAAHPVLYRYRQMTPEQRLDPLTDLGVAVWLMDDGSIKSTGHGSPNPYLRVYCCGFGAGFAAKAAEFFADRYGVTAKVCRAEKNPYLRIGAADTAKLLARLAPYIQYDAAANTKRWVAGPVAQGLDHGMVFVPVIRTEHITKPKRETRYDIEVEGTHTFVAGGVVVSNCAEALALRSAFPTALSGMFIEEEMDHVRSAENAEYMEELTRRRREAFAKAQAAKVNDGTTLEGELADPEQSDDAAEPTGADAEAKAAGELIEGEAALLLAELDEQARILGTSRAKLTQRMVLMYRCNAEDLPVDAVRSLVLGLRHSVAAAMEERNAKAAADTYRDLPQHGHPQVQDLLSWVPGPSAEAEAS